MNIGEELSADKLWANGGSAPLRLLVVEDDMDIAEVICAWFEIMGVQVVVAHRGAEALKHVVNAEFDAIICDMLMPQMRGDMFYIAVGRLKPHMSDRFIFITGYRDNPDVAKFLWQYCGPTLDKPLSLEELSRAVETVVQQRNEKRASAG